jgi:hypothetical protein
MRLAAMVTGVAMVVSSASTAGQPPTLLDEDAYAVYATALVSLARELPRIALSSDTFLFKPSCNGYTPPGWEDVATAHEQANAQRLKLQNGFDVGLPYRLVTTEELAAAGDRSTRYVEQRLGDRNPPVPQPFASYPGGKVFIVSAVGFSADRTRAMFMLQHTCGFACAGGHQILRVKVGGQWIDPPDVPERCSWVT